MQPINMSKTKKIAFSGIVTALYVIIMYFTASFAFGAYQIRIATALYALSYAFPFLVLPLAIANMLSNILNGQILDILGGFIVGLLTSGLIASLKMIKNKWGAVLIIPIIVLLPGFIVPIWLTYILGVPYWALVASLLIGQVIPAVIGYIIISIIIRRIATGKVYLPNKVNKEKDCSYALLDENETTLTPIEYSDNISGIISQRSFEEEIAESDTEEII